MTALHIILHGLIALVPLNDGAGRADHMMALVVDSTQVPADSPDFPTGCFPEAKTPPPSDVHMPMLTVFAKTTAQCLAAGCRVNDNKCACMLDHDLISLVFDPGFTLTTKAQLKKTPDSSLPFDLQAATDFSFIANLAQDRLGNQSVDQDLLATPIPPKDPQPLVARMDFPFTSAQACALATRPADGGKNVHAVGFRNLRAEEANGDKLIQAVAQGAVVHLEDIPAGQTVKVRLTKFDQSNPRDIEISAGLEGFEIELMNMRATELLPGDSCDDGIGRDFAFFYNLLPNPPAWKDRPIPHVKYTQWKSALDVDPDCRNLKDPNSRPICPMVSFN